MLESTEGWRAMSSDNVNVESTQKRVLIVEDDEDIAELLDFNLAKEGYITKHIANGEAVLPEVEIFQPELILLDLMLPGIGGVEVCRRLRSMPDSEPFIVMVTAKGSEADIVLGFEAGADDYVVKPFSPNELLARIRALFRRTPAKERPTSGGNPDDNIVFGPLQVSESERSVMIENTPVELTKSEFELLLAMIKDPGKVFRREELVQTISEGAFIGNRTIDVHVAALRRKIRPEGNRIETIRGVGYRFKKDGMDA